MAIVRPLDELELVLAYKFDHGELLLRALTHRSFANENPDSGRDNERLEFLGDAVVGLAVGHDLMERYPDVEEGALSVIRGRVVSEKGLSKVARALELGHWLRLGRGEEQTGGRDKDSLLANAFEAVVGAVYLDGGFQPAHALVLRLLRASLDETEPAHVDAKTQLQELAQAIYKSAPTYEVVSTSGPDHDKVFEIRVLLGDQEMGRAAGKSKKAAEQEAARLALRSLPTV